LWLRTGLNPTNFKCVPFLWQNGVMTQLPTLGGNNGWANSIHGKRGQSPQLCSESA
jgi:hypothetical protein